MDLSDFRANGPFFIPHDREALVVYRDESGGTMELKNSSNVFSLFPLNDKSALGYDGRRRNESGVHDKGESAANTQMALWDLATGERTLKLKGSHLGEVLGASAVDDERLLTWGRDYLVRSWNLQTGQELHAQPLPFVPLRDEQPGPARLSALFFGKLSRSEQRRYVDERHLPAPDLQLYAMREAGGAQVDCGKYEGKRLGQQKFRPFDWPAQMEPRLQAGMVGFIEDITGAEAGYSSVHRMKDGRAIIGGTTYGTSGIVYVWDGCYDLTLLFLGRASINFTIEGEHSTGRLRMSEYDECYEFDLSR